MKGEDEGREENEVAKDKETNKEEHEIEKETTMKRAEKISKRRRENGDEYDEEGLD